FLEFLKHSAAIRNDPCACQSGTRIVNVRLRQHPPEHEGDVPARQFEDSTGTMWEVFEVHRSSEAPRGVSAGLEKGWLAFVSAHGKRRLAPFPESWESATEREL